MSNFTVGEMVYPVRPESKKERCEFFPNWIDSMDQFDGVNGTVREIYNDGNISVIFIDKNENERCFAFKSSWLKKRKKIVG